MASVQAHGKILIKLKKLTIKEASLLLWLEWYLLSFKIVWYYEIFILRLISFYNYVVVIFIVSTTKYVFFIKEMLNIIVLERGFIIILF